MVQICWEQRSREQQQLFPSEPSLPLICTGHVAYLQFKKLMRLKAMWTLTRTARISPPPFLSLVKQQHQEPPEELEQHHGVILFLIHFIYLISTPNRPQGHLVFNKSIWRSFSWKAMPVGRSHLSTVCIKLKLHFHLIIYSILRLCIPSRASKRVKEITSWGKKRQISQCKHDFIAFI